MEDSEARRRIRWYTYVGDFLNTLKAFIGSNYQALPFAFANSGLAVGVVGVLLIATLTDHCCQILVSCKIYIIDRTCQKKLSSGKITESEVAPLRERLQLAIGYGDIGQHVLGPWCYQLIQAAVCFTQFVTCLVYFIFIANTVSMIFPLKHVESCHDDRSVLSDYWSSVFGSAAETPAIGIPMLNIANLGGSSASWHQNPTVPCNSSSQQSGIISYDEEAKNLTSPCEQKEISTAPDLRIIVLFPLPFFILTSLIRNVRYLAPLSSIATVALAVGAFSVLGFLIHGFHVVDFAWYKIFTLPLFLCQLISAYEGIGCILPIQSSMVGCRHLFPKYLHANIYLIFFVLCSFGILGYLSFGDKVNQIIVLEIEQHTVLSILVDITLIISVLFTYPLQCYPVIEIVESYVFRHKVSRGRTSAQGMTEEMGEREQLVRSSSLELSVSEVTNSSIPPTVASWKRNVVRVVVTLVIAGLAVTLRNYFAYLASFSGAIGGTLLAFILPCTMDVRLRYNEMSRLVLIKNICIIVFAIIVSILGIIVTIYKIVEGTFA